MPPLSVWPCDTPFGNTQEGPDRLRSAPITVPLFRGFGIPNRSVRCRLNPASLLLLSVCFFFCHAKPIIKLCEASVGVCVVYYFEVLWTLEHGARHGISRVRGGEGPQELSTGCATLPLACRTPLEGIEKHLTPRHSGLRRRRRCRTKSKDGNSQQTVRLHAHSLPVASTDGEKEHRHVCMTV
jgi:hypothetical protein